MEHPGNSIELTAAAKQRTREKNYWLSNLAGDPNKSFFPYDNKVSKKTMPQMKSFSFKFPGEIVSRLQKLSNQSELRLFILLATSVVVLLNKYTGDKDVIICSPIYKQEVECEYINTILPLRNPIHDGMTFKDLILQVSSTIFAASEHQNYPLKVLLNQLDMVYTEYNSPLFDIGVLLENIHDCGDLGGIPLNMIFVFNTKENGMAGAINYNTLLYHESSVRQIRHHLEQLLQQALFNVELRLDEISILSKQERNRLLFELNNTKTALPLDKVINELFESQAAMIPHHLAAGDEDQQVTYGELNKKTNQLSGLLRKKGIQRDTIVGIMADRSVDLLMGIMAVIKAGGAYLPITPNYPLARKAFILRDSGTRVILTQGNLLAKHKDMLQILAPGNIILLDQKNSYQGETHNPEAVNTSNNLAYVIYTSGTTGKPKGVMIEHQSLINFLYTMYTNYNGDVAPGDNCLSLTNISFDVNVCEVFLPLVFGAAVIFSPEEEVRDPVKLSRAIVDRAITFAYIPPGLIKELSVNLREYGTQVVLNKLLVGVEPINDYLLDQYRHLNGSMQIINGYGPTEATICTTSYQFNLHQSHGENVPIGKPLFNTAVVLLNNREELFPFGVPGELCISGAGLARGYLNRPDLTGEKFVKSPFFPGERMYKTGDFARWLPDENIRFQGRIDNQVKISGYRIELGEIETQLLKHKDIEKAVVIDLKTQAGDKYLCAYVVYSPTVKESGSTPTSFALINFLSGELPDYMLPVHVVALDNIPLTRNGKVDRKALPDPQTLSKVEYVAPGTENEKTIANIWKEILKLDNVGINDNFFEIGGNSLSVVKLKNRLQEEYAQEIPDVKILEYPTVSSFAGYLQQDVSRPGHQNNHNPEIDDNEINRLRLRSNIMEEDINV